MYVLLCIVLYLRYCTYTTTQNTSRASLAATAGLFACVVTLFVSCPAGHLQLGRGTSYIHVPTVLSDKQREQNVPWSPSLGAEGRDIQFLHKEKQKSQLVPTHIARLPSYLHSPCLQGQARAS
ncbi:hypothetical protein J3F83DRAFT_720717 [Trichoderma novae-zelandiae]